MVTDNIKEVIFVGLPGPTHNYGGLSADNVASSANRGRASNPRQAARQVLALVRLLKSLGQEAAILPPQLRPHLPLLRTRFQGDSADIIRQAANEDPALLEKACSSSAMWAANAATVTAAADSASGKLHITAANLTTNLHRRIEAEDTHRVLAAIFKNTPGAIVHPPLAPELRDEGAANHTRLCPSHDAKGLNLFVYGRDGGADDAETARQALAASQAIAKAHGIPPAQALFFKQHPDLIRQGVFHNDVIAVGNASVFLAHEKAYAASGDLARIEEGYRALHGQSPHMLIIKEEQLSVEEAVHSYFFNSQLVTLAGGAMAVIAPMEVRELYGGKAGRLMEKIRSDSGNPITEVRYVDLRQSMMGGGGPACLRLRVPMSEAQIAAVRESVNVMAGEALLNALEKLIERHYPPELSARDLADPGLYQSCRAALQDMAALMRLPLLA